MEVKRHELIKENNLLVTNYDKFLYESELPFNDRLKLYYEIAHLRRENQDLRGELLNEVDVTIVPMQSKLNKILYSNGS